MLPENDIEEREEEVKKYKAFYMDFENKCIGGIVDDREALIQAVRVALMTQRYKYPVFSHSYGIDYSETFDEGYEKAVGRLKNAVYDCLIYDDRINEVDDFKFERKGTKIIVSFRISSIYGPISYKTEVE